MISVNIRVIIKVVVVVVVSPEDITSSRLAPPWTPRIEVHGSILKKELVFFKTCTIDLGTDK